MKKKCNVVMLPTDGESRLYKAPWDEPAAIGCFENPMKTVKGDTIAQHLYLISDDEINQMDYYYDPEMNIIAQRTLSADQYEDCKKVIASTDPELYIKDKGKQIEHRGRKIHTLDDFYDFSTFSEDFIKAYVKANGEIDEVLVEYDVDCVSYPFLHREIKHCNSQCKHEHLLKLTDNNKVIIHLPEEKVYSAEEVAELIRKFRRDSSTSHEKLKEFLMKQCEEWIEENL